MEVRTEPRGQGTRCPYCHELLDDHEPEVRVPLRCADCQARFHLGCVAEASPRRCGVCGGRVREERLASGVARRVWRTARQPRSWKQRLLLALAIAAVVLVSIGIVYAELTNGYFVFLIVAVSACFLVNLSDGRWELNLRERTRRAAARSDALKKSDKSARETGEAGPFGHKP